MAGRPVVWFGEPSRFGAWLERIVLTLLVLLRSVLACRPAWFLLGLALGLSAEPSAPLAAGPDDPAVLCADALRTAEARYATPPGLLEAIAKTESGRGIGPGGTVRAWPWAVNIGGAGRYFETRDAAILAVRQALAARAGYVDVGCMQVNLAHHPQAFASLDQAFDPATNAAYAARFLNDLYATTRDWTRATAFYHSQTPERGELYQKRVAAVWPEEQKRLGITPSLPGHAFSRHAFSTNAWNSTAGPRTGVLAQSGRPQPAQVPPRRVATVAPGTGTRM